jgi:hypothetical protein
MGLGGSASANFGRGHGLAFSLSGQEQVAVSGCLVVALFSVLSVA